MGEGTQSKAIGLWFKESTFLDYNISLAQSIVTPTRPHDFLQSSKENTGMAYNSIYWQYGLGDYVQAPPQARVTSGMSLSRQE